MKLYETATCPQLPPVTATQKADILAADRTAEIHRSLFNRVKALNCLETGGRADKVVLPNSLNIAAWNVERCLNPLGTADLLRAQNPDVVLLSEMDNGMARTGQRNTIAEVADALGMQYTYGVEFFEMGLGGPTERPYCADDFNALGFHGNGILSRVAPDAVALIRLDDHGHWFCSDTGADLDQPRIGGRMAVAAILPCDAGKICVVSTHFESNSGAAGRQSQMDRLMAAIDAFAPGLPVVIGGDLNTGNHLPNADWTQETLFAAAQRHGYDWQANADGMTTRKSLLTLHPDRAMKLDWFAIRGGTMTPTSIIPALEPDGTPLSDHELICAYYNVAD
ncbi:endonuclease/exonuclease/phosphatase family protein [Aestuariibius sp. HNIBRBA575]|uniref:endonuclease/exonuclease/phosphatase family protein n=1 Tax=Aestuariibius sp. HNIBRBA575 TaxID=3233343 RepID=UPI0034A45C6B